MVASGDDLVWPKSGFGGGWIVLAAYPRSIILNELCQQFAQLTIGPYFFSA
jgi:hypothetical protein